MKPSPEILVSYLRIQADIHDKLFGFSIFSKRFFAGLNVHS